MYMMTVYDIYSFIYSHIRKNILLKLDNQVTACGKSYEKKIWNRFQMTAKAVLLWKKVLAKGTERWAHGKTAMKPDRILGIQ